MTESVQPAATSPSRAPLLPFGKQLRRLRRARGMSLREFSRRVGISAPYMSDIEHSRRHPSPRVTEAMARVLGMDAAALRALDTSMPLTEMRDLAEADPTYGLALRRILDAGVTSEELLRVADQKASGQRAGVVV